MSFLFLLVNAKSAFQTAVWNSWVIILSIETKWNSDVVCTRKRSFKHHIGDTQCS